MRQEGESINVLTVLGKKYTIDEDTVCTVGELKSQLHKLAGIEPERQHLIINGILCKDPSAALFKYGSNPVCILAQKVDGEVDQPPPTLSNRKSSHEKENKHVHSHSDFSHFQYITFERFLTRQEKEQYKKQVENSYSREGVKQLMSMMDISQELAIRAVRACCNDISDAIDYVSLQLQGHNYQELTIENKPIRDAPNEQTFLMAYVEQQQLRDRLSSSKQAYTLFVASLKEKSPIVYDMLIRNKIFMEKLLFEQKNPTAYIPSRNISKGNMNSKINSLRVSLVREEKEAMVKRLMDFGLPRVDAEWRLREAGNNILLAEQQIMEGQAEVDDDYLIDMLPGLSREHIVKIFFQSPIWEPFKAKLKKMHFIQARDLIMNRLQKHFPRIFSLVNNLWVIFPLLIGVPYSSIENVKLLGEKPRQKLRVRTAQQREKINKYYMSLVDMQAVEIFANLGADTHLAERALRATVNLCHFASMYIIAGKIAVYAEAWTQNEDSELKIIHSYMTNVIRHAICDKREFELQVAALAQINPAVYQCFVKYEGIHEAYWYMSAPSQIIAFNQRQRGPMKMLLRRMRDIWAFYEWGYKSIQLTSSSFR